MAEIISGGRGLFKQWKFLQFYKGVFLKCVSRTGFEKMLILTT